MNRTGLIMDALYQLHDPGVGHPESSERLTSIYSLIEKEGLDTKCQKLKPRKASEEEICRVHSKAYYQRVYATDGKRVALDPDTATSKDSFRAAELAAGGVCVLTEQVVSGSLDNGYALVRPPGHHAEKDRAMGFCLFNNVAIAAEHALKTLGIKRVLIVDWDLHQGNGTMHSFYDRDDVMYFSTHQYPYYPGTGALNEVGAGKGKGYTINVPLSPGMGDLEYRAIFREILTPLAHQFKPELFLISTGFDTYVQDPLGGMKMTAQGFGQLTAELMVQAQTSAQGKLVLCLEGGYDLEGLSQGVVACLNTLLEKSPSLEKLGSLGKAAEIIQAVKAVQSTFWKF